MRVPGLVEGGERNDQSACMFMLLKDYGRDYRDKGSGPSQIFCSRQVYYYVELKHILFAAVDQSFNSMRQNPYLC